MVDVSNPVREVAGQLIARIFSGVLWFGIAIIILGVVGFLMWYFLYYKKQFNIKVKIRSERAGGSSKIIFDKAAILVDRKTKSKYFKIWGLRISLPVPKFEILQSTNEGDLLEIWRKGEEDFVYLSPPKVDRETIVKADGKLYPIASQEHKQIEADIAFWNVKRKNLNRGMFSPESLLMKLIPYMPFIFSGVIMIFILYILLDSLPGILGELTALTSELRSLKGASTTAYGLIPLLFTTWKKN